MIVSHWAAEAAIVRRPTISPAWTTTVATSCLPFVYQASVLLANPVRRPRPILRRRRLHCRRCPRFLHPCGGQTRMPCKGRHSAPGPLGRMDSGRARLAAPPLFSLRQIAAKSVLPASAAAHQQHPRRFPKRRGVLERAWELQRLGRSPCIWRVFPPLRRRLCSVCRTLGS